MPISATKYHNFKKSYPVIARDWSIRNKKGPDQYTPKSGQKVWWTCKKGHEWEAVISSRANGTGCPKCNGQEITPERSLQSLFPQIAAEWHYMKNRPVTPVQIFPTTAKKYWWLCSKGHPYEASPGNRSSNGRGCPNCSNQKVLPENSIETLHPNIAKQFSKKNAPLTAKQLSQGSNRLVWWHCVCGHDWEATPYTRIQAGSGCPACANRTVTESNSLLTKFPEIAAEWDYSKNLGLTPGQVIAGSAVRISWICPLGHSYSASVRKRTGPEKTACPKCSNQTSRNELRIYSELKVVYPDAENRAKLIGMELDIHIKSIKIGIEYDGHHFHKSHAARDRAKGKKFEGNGLRLIRIREHPLKAIGPFDYIMKERRPSKHDIDGLLDKIQLASGRPNQLAASYKKKPDFVNNDLWLHLVSAIPLPPTDKSLIQNKKLAKEWNYERNKPLTPENVFARSGVSYWWICKHDHEWEATVDHRVKGRGCPYCSNHKVGYGNSLAEKAPSIAAEWYFDGNGDYTPHNLTFRSGKSIWWKCSSNHIFRARIVDRVERNSKCLHCPGPGRGRRYRPPNTKLFYKKSKADVRRCNLE